MLLVEGLPELVVDAFGLGELILQDHDAARALGGIAIIDQLAYPCGNPQLLPRVAAVPAR